MTMTMYIVMTMNIYIKPNIEELLRKYDGSMGGLVNRLLEDFFQENTSAATGVRREIDKAEEDEGWVESNPPRKAEKLPCCLGSKPCKHWVWDMSTGDGYVNTLTGEVREV